MVNEALKFVWAYMIKEGRETTGDWSQYSGFETKYNRYDPGQTKQKKDLIAHKIQHIGIDWEKTKSPVSSQANKFNGTFVESSTVETLLGTLVFKDGSKVMLGVGNAEKRFCSYVENLAQFMEDKNMVKEILGENV